MNSLISLYCMYTTVTILIIVYSTLYSVLSVTLCCSIQNLYTVLFVLQMSICVCTQISMRVRESRDLTSKPSSAVQSISKPRSRGIPHYITPSPAGNPQVPAIIPKGGNPCRPLLSTGKYFGTMIDFVTVLPYQGAFI